MHARSILLLLMAIAPFQARAGAADLRAGAAAIDITPPTGFAMWGYAARHDAPSVGVLDRLRARALVLAAGDSKIALVALDLGRAPTRDSMATIRKLVAKAGIEEPFLVGSHTHHGPVIELDAWPSKEKSYVRELERKLADVILAADAKLQPARLGVASMQTTGLNRNRHSKRDDRPVDRELLVLRVEDAGGKPIAHAVNFAAHPTILDAKLLEFSPDYPGSLCATIEKEAGGICLFLQGAAGDLSPDRKRAETAEAYGKRLADECLKLARAIRCEEVKKPSLVAEHESFRFRPRLDMDNALTQFALGKAFFPELIAFYGREYREGVRPQLTLAILNEKVGFVGVSGEFFCGHSLSLKRRARLEHLFFLGYCNDYHQYFPTIEAASEKGYGTEPPVSQAELGAGEKMMDRAVLRLYQMRGLVPER